MEKIKQIYLIRRVSVWLFGVALLVLGVSMGTSSGLGIAPMSSFPLALSRALGIRFSVLIGGYYLLLVAAQFLIRGKDYRKMDLLQLPFSFIFSALMDVAERFLVFHFDHLWQNILLQAGSIVVLGIGVVLTVGMRIAPNPTDGLVYTISDHYRKDLGLVKNIADTISVSSACVLDLVFGGKLTSAGLGTVMAMIFIGRVVALVNRSFSARLFAWVGLKQRAA